MKNKKIKILSIVSVIAAIFLVIGLGLFSGTTENRQSPGINPTAEGATNQKLTQDFKPDKITLEYTMRWANSPTNRRDHGLWEKEEGSAEFRFVALGHTSGPSRSVKFSISGDSSVMRYNLKPNAEYKVASNNPANLIDPKFSPPIRVQPLEVKWYYVTSHGGRNAKAFYDLKFNPSTQLTGLSLKLEKADDNGSGLPGPIWTPFGVSTDVDGSGRNQGFNSAAVQIQEEPINIIGKHVRVIMSVEYIVDSVAGKTFTSNSTNKHIRIGFNIPAKRVTLDFDRNGDKKIKTKLLDMVPNLDTNIISVSYALYTRDTINGTPKLETIVSPNVSPNYDLTFDNHEVLPNKYYQVRATVVYAQYSLDVDKYSTITFRSQTKFSFFDNNDSIFESAELAMTGRENNAFKLEINFKPNVNVTKVEYQKEWSADGQNSWAPEGNFEEGESEGQKYTKFFTGITRTNTYYRVKVKIFLNGSSDKYHAYTFSAVHFPQSSPLKMVTN